MTKRRKPNAPIQTPAWRKVFVRFRKELTFGAFLAAIGWVLVSADTVVKNATALSAWMRDDESITGTWTNSSEGTIGGDKVAIEDVVWISLRSVEGEVVGIIHSHKLCSFQPWPYAQFKGENGWISAQGTAFDFRNDKEVIFGSLKLVPGRKSKSLTLRITSPSPVFAKSAELYRLSTDAKDEIEGVSPLCAPAVSPRVRS